MRYNESESIRRYPCVVKVMEIAAWRLSVNHEIVGVDDDVNINRPNHHLMVLMKMIPFQRQTGIILNSKGKESFIDL